MNIFNLKADLTLNKAEYDRGIEEAKNQGDDFADHTATKVSPKAKTAWMAIVAAIMAVVKAVAGLAKSSMDYADNVSNLAAQYGLATDAIGEMQYIADQSSTSVEGLTSAMTMLLNRAKEDGEAFQKLGVSVHDANGNFKQMDELFYETIGALNEIENEGERSALMLETFGRSAMNVGEVVRKTSDELAQMRQEAHDMGVVLEESTINFASDFNDEIAVLKLQMQSAMASMVAGAPDAEERFDAFMQNLLKVCDKYLPSFVQFFVRLAHSVGTQLFSIAPTLVADIISIIIQAIFDTNWFQVGVDIIKGILEGVLNVGGAFLRELGFDVGKVDLGIGEYEGKISTPEITTSTPNTGSVPSSKKIDVNVNVNGDTPIDQENAKKIAESLVPYIDQILGDK